MKKQSEIHQITMWTCKKQRATEITRTFSSTALHACFRLLKTPALSKKLLRRSVFQMIFPVHPRSKDFIRSYECYRKRWHRLALSIFICISTALLSKNCYQICQCLSAHNCISLPFALASRDPLNGNVLHLVRFSNRFSFPSRSPFWSFRFCNTLLRCRVFQKLILLILRKNFLPSNLPFFPDFFVLPRFR